MWRNPKAVFQKRPDFKKLEEYGFQKQKTRYFYTMNIMEGAFCLTVFVTQAGATELEVTDQATGEEYSLVYVADAVGAFVGAVRTACQEALQEIVAHCYESDIFKSEYAKLVLQYMRSSYGAEAEYLWEKFPNNAVFRDAKTGKWFGALLTVEKRKIGIEADGVIEIMDLKETPEQMPNLVDGVRYFAGYHMNKKHWYTVCLDGSVPIAEIYERIDNSFRMVSGKNRIKIAKDGHS